MSDTTQRFTPPTCTLEITKARIPLSHRTKQNIWQQLKFKLKFDDPRIATANQVIIKGKEQDLAKLQRAINNYVPEHLHSPSESFTPQINSQVAAQAREDDPHLESQGLDNHKLYFGNLLHNSNSDYIKLSTVQLFDLVTALAAYQAEIATLPDSKQSTSAGKKIFFWGGMLAVALAAVGGTTILSQSHWQDNNSSTQTESPTLADLPELAEIIPPAAPETNTNNSSQPQRTKPLTSATRLPPPPAVDTPKPKPDIPDPADYPLADVARQSGFDNSPKLEESTEQPQKITTVVPPVAPEKPEIITQNNITQDNTTELKLSATNQSPLDTPATSALNSNLALRDTSDPAIQIQEITTYFKNHWQPPADLKQSLEYRLMLNADGSIKKIIPLGKASRLYLSQTKIPVNGESFISPSTTAPSSTIRLLLNPDGQIQAFVE